MREFSSLVNRSNAPVRLRFLFVAAAVSAVLVPLPAKADVIFSNFGPNNDYYYGGGPNVFGPNYNSYLSQVTAIDVAVSFTAFADISVSKVELPFRHISGSDSYNFQLVNDSSGLPSTSILASGNFWAPNTPGIIPLNVSASLIANSKYWIVITPGDPTTLGSWNANSIAQTGNYAQQGHPSQPGAAPYWNAKTETTPTFRVTGSISAVPEPGTIALLLLPAFLGTTLLQRTRRKTAAVN